jgi:hypothetical protein
MLLLLPASLTVSSVCGVSCLRHEVLDDSVEGAAIVVALQAQLHKVAHSLRHSGSAM